MAELVFDDARLQGALGRLLLSLSASDNMLEDTIIGASGGAEAGRTTLGNWPLMFPLLPLVTGKAL